VLRHPRVKGGWVDAITHLIAEDGTGSAVPNGSPRSPCRRIRVGSFISIRQFKLPNRDETADSSLGAYRSGARNGSRLPKLVQRMT